MSGSKRLPPLRVEQALRLLPDVDALAPLRAFLVSSSRAQRTSGPYRTVGKRQVHPADLRDLVPRAVARVTDHLASLYEAAVQALEAEQRADLPGTVRALLQAGAFEERVGRHSQAREWFIGALAVAEGLRDRKPEIETLNQLGRLESARGHLDAGARYYQRSLALAEAELEQQGAAVACLGIGMVSLAQVRWKGAESWFNRGLRYAEHDPALRGHLTLGLGEVACALGQFDAATQRLDQARRFFDEHDDAAGAARVLNAHGLLALQSGRYADALVRFQEAMARLQRAEEDPPLEMIIRLNTCRLYIEWGRFADAEDEGRRAEELAIVHNLVHPLARLYLILGTVGGRQHDESAFVFFEKAIELCRGAEPSPRIEAEVYLEYGQFRKALGDGEEARAYLERAREILETLNDGSLLAKVETELALLSDE